jgi:hypothetical protein
MSNTQALDLPDLTTYSPVRVFLTGIWRFLFGAMIAASFYALAYAVAKTADQPRSAADPPRWLLYAAGLLFAFLAVLCLSSGLGRMISAFSQGCFFRAGRAGISIRLPKRGWFGRFRLAEYWMKWSEVDRLVHFTYRTNGIPTSTELRIYLLDKTMLRVERMYFSASPKHLQLALLAIQAEAGR